MTLIDFDGLFDEKLTQYMENNKNKYTEKQWEDVIPKLYKKFGDTYVAKVKCTPKEYYAKMTNEALAQTLSAHLSQDVPVPEFLCAEIEKRGEVDTILPLLDGGDMQSAIYAINLLGGDARAFNAYFAILEENRFDEDVRCDAVDILKTYADEVKEHAYMNWQKGVATEYMLEIISRIKQKEDRFFDALMSAFLGGENLPMRASYLAAYGDERALPALFTRIEDKTIGFVEFQELKYAIESLGGEYTEVRDFSEDKDYLAVEVASAKAAMREEETHS